MLLFVFKLQLKEKKQITEGNVQSVIGKYLRRHKLEIEELKLPSNKQYRDDLIRLLNRESDLSLRRIADVLRINREVVRRATLVMSKEPLL